MKQEFVDWFLNFREGTKGHCDYVNRKYSYSNIHMSQVPFHQELSNYIFSLHSFKHTYYDVYHIHTWSEGDFFDEHVDSILGRKWAYVCELKPSDCNTSLLVEGKVVKEGVFDSNTVHSVPLIKKRN